MQANSVNHSFYGTSDSVFDLAAEVKTPEICTQTGTSSEPLHPDELHSDAGPMTFHGQFENCMEMYAEAAAVAQYLDSHHEWFRRCAQPMAAEPLGENGYALTIGRFGAFNYEVEPKIGLDLLPQDHGVYRIRTIPVPDYQPPGYDVDFRASLQLLEREVVPEELPHVLPSTQLPSRFTSVDWELDLKVMLHFPRFIHAIPRPIIQTTGDRLLNQIVRQVSKRLTYKVQEDFHQEMGIPFSKKRRRPLWA